MTTAPHQSAPPSSIERRDVTPEEAAWLAMGPFDGGIAGLVRRVRRRLDLSQRALAARLGISQSRVARWETGRTAPRVEMLQRLLRLVGDRLVVLDEDEHVVTPMRDDGARDRGGRRYPAHVDLEVVGWWAPHETASAPDRARWLARSRQRRDPAVTFALAPWLRRITRRLRGTPVDHPAVHQLAAEAEWLDDEWDARRAS